MQARIEIQNLKCNGCANTIKNKLANLEDISDLHINTESSLVTFVHKNDSTLLEVRQVLNKIGYPVVGSKNALTTKAKSFVSCAIGRVSN
ncbi:heavy-metal-associated domain-containing protein [Tamlana sp. 2201CG12-4]|uniref:heavy-metal-associated domain-containing protein n=1 Tax=Tamlana sp. 2201CG12-4 TaxID=3112582 RepID=UPI002DB6D906|nr:heavy-metal-associated domain-containing protein [Tamlana sp. 2201CG12-4]MEC3907504.1 heavy-metal-associated domain-containing protein [Tamlana sp. 2201CG12-4]